MLSNLTSIFKSTPPAKPQETLPNGKLLLQLLHEHSPIMMEALESKAPQNSGALAALLWANAGTSTNSTSKKFDLQNTNSQGDTFLLRTAITGDYPEATQKLLKGGADINHQNTQGQDALIINTLNRHPKALQVLLDHVKASQDPNPEPEEVAEGPLAEQQPIAPRYLPLNQDNEGITALGHALQQGDNYAIYQLTEAQVNPNLTNPKGETALIQATKAGNTYACLRLLKNQAAILPQDNEGKTALMHWIQNIKIPSNTETLSHIIGHRLFSKQWKAPGFLTISQQLVEGSLEDINAQDIEGRTALSHIATSPIAHTTWGNAGAAGLLQNGANVDLPDQNGLTPVMHFAKVKPNNFIENVRATNMSIFARSQEINKKDSSGKTALIHSAENGNLLALLAILTGNYNQPFLGRTRQHRGEEINPNIQDENRQTALMALSALDPNVANLPLVSKIGQSIYKVIGKRFNSTRLILEQLPYNNQLSRSVKMLLLIGADPKLKNKDGETALMIAARHGSLPVLQVLCECPETLNQKNPEGKTALQLAQENHQDKAIKMLLKAGAFQDA